MSRIAGILSKKSENDIFVMLRAQSSSSYWFEDITELNDVKFGYVGLDRDSLILRDGIQVVIDGAIYNATEFGSGGDAEIILNLYRKHGFPGMLQLLNGDFAIALYDSGNNECWLGRDRFGIRPLYYCQNSSGDFLFASRCKSLLALPGVSHDLNRQYVALVAASHYRHFDNQPGKSPYEHIAQLPAASWLRAKDGDISMGDYWKLEDLPDWPDSEDQLAERYLELLLDATKIRIARAERPAFTLSGGMDSSSVICSAVRVQSRKQQAFSSVYKDKTYDESDDIRTILDHAVTDWHQVDVSDPDVFGLIEKMVEANDEPVATATWLSHYEVCRQASQSGVTHLFGGLGGDELNAGEYEHFFPFFADLKVSGRGELLALEVEKWVEYHDHPIHKKSFAVMEATITRTCDLNRPGVCRPDRARLEKYHSLLNPHYFDLEQFEPVMDHPFRSYLKNRCYQDIFRETSPCCLRAQDRQGMAFGIQHIMPFFDHRIVEFMFRVPGTLKFREGVTKTLLRMATKDLLPDETRNRITKTGWNAPAHIWFSGESADRIRDLVRSQWFRDTGIYNVQKVDDLLKDHCEIVETGKPVDNHMMLFWQLVNLATWMKA